MNELFTLVVKFNFYAKVLIANIFSVNQQKTEINLQTFILIKAGNSEILTF